MPAVKVYGDPVPKGSMRCLGAGSPRGFHQLVDNNDRRMKPWAKLVAGAGKALFDQYGVLSGPLKVEVTFTLPRPASVPLRKRLWPFTRSAGDIDKLARGLLDPLTVSGLWPDDSLVVELHARKTYPDTPGVPDRLDRPGALIRIDCL